MITITETPIFTKGLKNGDRLTRSEFEARFEALSDLKKAELIEGVVYMSPVRTIHSGPHAKMIGWLYLYAVGTLGTDLHDNPSIRLDVNNEPQPDALLRIETALGGRTIISEDSYIEGGPELIVEIAASSVSYDTGTKKNLYSHHRVQEYLVWQVAEARIDWWQLSNGQYVLLMPDQDQIIRSQVFPGLWLDVGALLENNLVQVIEVLRQGMATTEHLAFVQRLASLR